MIPGEFNIFFLCNFEEFFAFREVKKCSCCIIGGVMGK